MLRQHHTMGTSLDCILVAAYVSWKVVQNVSGLHQLASDAHRRREHNWCNGSALAACGMFPGFSLSRSLACCRKRG